MDAENRRLIKKLKERVGVIDQRVADLSEEQRRAGMQRLLQELESTGTELDEVARALAQGFCGGSVSFDEFAKALAGKLR